MFDVKEIRKDFPMLDGSKTIEGHPVVYLDNGATTLKPKPVIDAIVNYYSSCSANIHRGDYDLAYKADVAYANAREKVSKFIGAKSKEIVFTSGTTMSINMIAYGYSKKLKAGDVILIDVTEHASNVLPWFNLAKSLGVKIEYIPLDEKGQVTKENLRKVMNSQVKLVSITQVSNVLGYINDIKELAKIVHEYNAIFVCDGAQSTPHMKIDVKDLDVDFFAFSGHKLCGPTGIGVLYGKYELLENMDSMLLGGGMNNTFEKEGTFSYLPTPTKFEAGTPNIAGAIGLGAAISYLENIGLDNIASHERELKKYAVKRLLEECPNVTVYNPDSPSGIIDFNIKDVPAQDAGSHYNHYGVCVRTGEHCAKLLDNFLNVKSTVRCSIYFYNTKEDIDTFIEATKEGGNFLDAFFN
jgi:cysteine desulfurase/selenocysteine lyase